MSESKSKKTGAAQLSKAATKTETNTTAPRQVSAMTYGGKAIKLSLIGIVLIALGMILMSGGAMPSPDVWDESIIYSARRMVLAPLSIIAGLVLQVFAIFKV